MSTRSLDIIPRVLLTKIGLDGHDRGVRVLTQALRDAGQEVIYLGPWAEIDAVVAAATQEDADVVGVSSLAYDHLLVPTLVERLRSAGSTGDVLIGGIVQEADVPMLERAGVSKIFHTGHPLPDIVQYVHAAAERRRRELT